MATTTLPVKKERFGKLTAGIKPGRAMTHPLQKPSTNATKFQPSKQGQPFDPEDLSRRLQSHIINQRIRAEQRRNARLVKVTADFVAEEKASQVITTATKIPPLDQENGYHHVPKVAALAFARTATPDPLRKIQKLSEPVAPAQTEKLVLDEPAEGAKVAKQAKPLEREVVVKEILKDRSQVRKSKAMLDASEVDIYREVYRPPQRTLKGEFSSLLPGHHDKKIQRPLSMGDVLEDDDDALTLTRTQRKSKPPGFDMSERNNWAQQDEPDVKSPKKETVRRKPSSWILLGRRSPKLDKEKDEAVAGVGEAGSPPGGSSKSAKLGFLARFKRHPS